MTASDVRAVRAAEVARDEMPADDYAELLARAAAAPTIIERADGWHVVTDGASVGFADRWSAEQYAATLTCEAQR